MSMNFNPACVCGGTADDPNPDCERCQMQSEIERLRAALKQYADKDNWNSIDLKARSSQDWWQGECAGYEIADAALNTRPST